MKKVSVFLLTLFVTVLCSRPAYTQTIYTFAGTGTYGYAGDGLPATAALLQLPTGLAYEGSDVAVDIAGNVYIADEYNNVIRRVTTTGIISTVVGDNSYGFVDGVTALSAEMANPAGLAVDAGGNMYIADYWNSRIRKVNSAGIISTIAGTGTSGYLGDGFAATNALLATPNSVALDAAGNVFFSDDQNHVVRKINATTGVISTVAGTGSGGYTGDGVSAITTPLDKPWSLAFDATGNLYIADYGNNRVRMVNASGIISTVAGNGTSSYGGDGLAAVSCGLVEPRGIALDAGGNLYIACGDNRIVMVNSLGKTVTVAGTGTGGYTTDGVPATTSELNRPIRVAFDHAGNMYIVDEENDRVRIVTSPIKASFSAATTITCQDSCVTFMNTTTTTTDSITWSATGATVSATHSNTISACFTAAGTNTITLTAYKNGSSSIATNTVTVTPTPHPVIGRSGHVLSLTGSYSTFQWYNGSALITGATSSSYTYTSPGNYTVKVDSAGCLGTSSAYSTLGVTEIPGEVSVKLVPNPNNGTFMLTGSIISTDNKATIGIYDMIGNEVYKNTVAITQNSVALPISLNNTSTGVYLLKVSTEAGSSIERLVITK